MGLKHLDITLGSSATAMTTHANLEHLKYLKVENEADNNEVYVGGSNVTDSSYGISIPGGQTEEIFRFSGEGPVSSHLVYFFGTNGQVIHVLYVPH